MVTRDRGCVCSTARAAGSDGPAAAEVGGEERRAVEDPEVKGMGLERLEEEEEEAAFPVRKAAECPAS